MRTVFRLVLFVAVTAMAVPAFGQTHFPWPSLISAAGAPPPAAAAPALEDSLSSPQPRALRRHQPMGLRLFGYVEIESEAAKQSFKAVTGSSILIGFGGGLELTHIGGPFMLRVAYGQASKSGERVVAFDDEAFSTGIPMTVKKSPLEVGFGWRGGRGGSEPTGIAPYVGGGLLLLKYQETSTESFVDPSDNTSQTFTGFHAFGGIDLSMGRHLSIGLEGQYRTVPNAIGDTGVSATYGEKDLGGFAARVSFGFKK